MAPAHTTATIGKDHGGGHGGGTGFAHGKGNGQVAAAQLGHLIVLVFTHQQQLFLGQAGLHAAVDHSHGGGNSAQITNDLFNALGKLVVLGIGHAVAQNGAFQCHNGLTGGNGLGDFGGDIHILLEIHHNTNSFTF